MIYKKLYVIINDRRILQYKRIYFIVQSTETSYTIFINLITTIITNVYFLHSNFETGGVTCINHAGYFKFPKPAFSRQAIYRQAIYNQNDFRKIYVLSLTQKRIKELYDLHIHRDALNLSSNVSFLDVFFLK